MCALVTSGLSWASRGFQEPLIYRDRLMDVPVDTDVVIAQFELMEAVHAPLDAWKAFSRDLSLAVLAKERALVEVQLDLLDSADESQLPGRYSEACDRVARVRADAARLRSLFERVTAKLAALADGP